VRSEWGDRKYRRRESMGGRVRETNQKSTEVRKKKNPGATIGSAGRKLRSYYRRRKNEGKLQSGAKYTPTY